MEKPLGPFPRIFVSHSSIDNDFGIKLAADLRHILGDDHAVWYDVLGYIQEDDPWWQKIVEALRDCEIFILLLSPDTMKSEGTLRELAMALAERKRIVLLLYKQCETPADLKAFHPLSFLPPKPYEVAFHELLTVLGLSEARQMDLPIPLHKREVSRPGISIRAAILGLLKSLMVLVLVGTWGLLFYVSIAFTITTYNAEGTAIAQINATATADADAEATAVAQINAAATATANVTADNPDPYPPTNGRLVLYDPLRQSSNWTNESDDSFGGTCQFTNGSYSISETKSLNVFPCYARNSDFRDFAFEVQMKIIKGGECGGMIFRASQAGNYVYVICWDGAYDLHIFTSSNQKDLRNTHVSGVHTGLNQSNTIAVVADGSKIDLYVNDHKIDSVQDTTSDHGGIALLAADFGHPTGVIYSYAKVWTL